MSSSISESKEEKENNMKKILSFLIFGFILLLNGFSSAAEIVYTCDGWASFNLEGNSKDYILRLSPDNTPREIIRSSVKLAESATGINIANDLVIYAQSKGKKASLKQIPYFNGGSRSAQIICWRHGIDKVPDLSHFPKDNTERTTARSALPPPRPMPAKDDSSVYYQCTQRLVFYLMGEDPKSRQPFIFYGKKDSNGKFIKYRGPLTAAQGAIRTDALNELKKMLTDPETGHFLTFMLVDDPTAICQVTDSV